MTIRPGEAWGRVAPAPAGTVVVRSDAELGALVREARGAGAAPPPVALLGGDLMRAVGGTGDERRLDGEVAVLPVDLVRVEVDSVAPTWFVAHLVARRPTPSGGGWRGPLLVAVNGQYAGGADVAPRAHPNDGRVDVLQVDAAMPLRQRLAARRRATTGTHLPHPALALRQAAEVELDAGEPLVVHVDGVRWRRAARLRLVVEPDALTVCV